MPIEDKIRLELKKRAESIEVPRELDQHIRLSIKTMHRKKEIPLMKKRLMAGVVAAALLIPTGVFAGPYLADQIFGSKENLLKHGGSPSDFQALEAKLQAAKKVLGEQEYEQFAEKLKQFTDLQMKTTDQNGAAHPEKLNAEERKQYEQTMKELEKYFDQLNKANSIEDQLETLSIEESQKLVSFPIKYPAYLPDGYALDKAVGTIWKEGKDQIPAITMHYQKDSEEILVTMIQLENNDQPHMAQPFEKTTDYTLDGYAARYGEKGKRGRIGVQIVVPQTSKQSAYAIYVSGPVEKAQLEKIALSIAK